MSQFRLTVFSSEPEAPEQREGSGAVGKAEDTNLAEARLALETQDELWPCGNVTVVNEETQPDTGDAGDLFRVVAWDDPSKGCRAGPVESDDAIGPSNKVAISEKGQVGKR